MSFIHHGQRVADCRPYTAEELAKLAQNPGAVEGWILLGRSYASEGRRVEARDALGRALQLSPDDPALLADAERAVEEQGAGKGVAPDGVVETRAERSVTVKGQQWHRGRLAAVSVEG